MSLSDKIYVRDSFLTLAPLTDDCGLVFCIYDSNVKEYMDDVKKTCPQIKNIYSIKATEQNKVIETVLGICEWLLDNDANRNDLLLTVGGGITSDIGGFAASIYKRGISYANIPTTLLSQVDAAIGGKNGVNFKAYKNILGTIVQPKFTFINVSTLSTLPKRQFLSGVAELLKTFILGDGNGYFETVSCFKENDVNKKDLVKLIKKAAGIKASVVERDEYEHGERKHLNLGHTFAHAIEWYQQDKGIEDGFSHGEAVAIGICLAAKMSEALGICNHGLASKIIDDFMACGLRTVLPYPIATIEDAFFKDKKAEIDGVYFVLIKDIGMVETHFVTKELWSSIKHYFLQ